jgi:hypothetical protein
MKDIDGEDGENDGNKSDIDDWDAMYMEHVKEKQIGSDDENENGSEDRDGVESGGEDRDGVESGGEDRVEDEVENGSDSEDAGEDKDEEEFGGNDDEGRNGEGSRSAKQAGTKRKVIPDDELAPATRAKKIQKKTNGSEGYQAAAQPTKKALPKRKYSKRRV